MNRFLDIEVLHSQSYPNFSQNTLEINSSEVTIFPILSGISIEDVAGDNCDYVAKDFTQLDRNTKYYRDAACDQYFGGSIVYRSEWKESSNTKSATILLYETKETSYFMNSSWEGPAMWIFSSLTFHGVWMHGNPYLMSANLTEWYNWNGSGVFTAQIPGIVTVGVQGKSATGFRYKDNVWQYSNGENWVSLSGNSSISINGEPITFTNSDLINGILTIHHNLGKYPLGIDYTITPKDIEFTDENTLTLDYSDQENISGQVWFIGSKSNMGE